MRIDPVSDRAPIPLISSPKRRPHLNSSKSSNGTLIYDARIGFIGVCYPVGWWTPSWMARKEDSQSRATHCAGTKMATVKSRARTQASRMCMLLLIFLVRKEDSNKSHKALFMRRLLE